MKKEIDDDIEIRVDNTQKVITVQNNNLKANKYVINQTFNYDPTIIYNYNYRISIGLMNDENIYNLFIAKN